MAGCRAGDTPPSPTFGVLCKHGAGDAHLPNNIITAARHNREVTWRVALRGHRDPRPPLAAGSLDVPKPSTAQPRVDSLLSAMGLSIAFPNPTLRCPQSALPIPECILIHDIDGDAVEGGMELHLILFPPEWGQRLPHCGSPVGQMAAVTSQHQMTGLVHSTHTGVAYGLTMDYWTLGSMSQTQSRALGARWERAAELDVLT